MLNMVNWFSCYDLASGEQSPYYEPLCDDLVFELPLPCSDAKWLARSEAEWWAAVRSEEVEPTSGTIGFENVATDEQSGVALFDTLMAMWESSAARRNCTAQKTFNTRIHQKAGLFDSEQFRNLIVLAALHQRPQSNS
jgi:hypothetical protein